MIRVESDWQYKKSGLQRHVKRAAEETLRHEDKGQGDLSVVLTGDRMMKKLNRQYRGESQSTDVLSFPSEAKANGNSGYLGDIVISVVRARQQAKSAGHSLSDEVKLLTVHGVLHLLGYDHADPKSKARMWAAQDEILNQMGVHINVDQAVAAHGQN